VHDTSIQSDLKAILVAVPMMLVLLTGFFRLDQLFAAPKRRNAPRRPPTGTDENGAPILCDPDPLPDPGVNNPQEAVIDSVFRGCSKRIRIRAD